MKLKKRTVKKLPIYVGNNNVAKKVSKIYAGVNGTAKEVKKVYVGINNVAKLCFDNTTPTPQIYTWNDFKSFVQYCYTNNIRNSTVTTSFLQKVLNYISAFESSATSNHIDLTQYNNFFAENNGRGGINYWITDLSTEYYCDGTVAQTSKLTGYTWTNDIPNFVSLSNASRGFYLGLASSEPTNGDYEQCIMQNKWIT